MALKVLIIAVVVAAAFADYNYAPPSNAYGVPSASVSYLPPAPANEPTVTPQYDFEYEVKDRFSGNDFGHKESRVGDFTEGEYFVNLPDGRLQRVSYTVNGDSGFVAEVSYE